MNTAIAENASVAEGADDTLVQGALGLVRSIVHNELAASVIVAALIILLTALVTHLVTKLLRKTLSHERSPLPQSTIFVNIWRVCAWAIGLSFMLSACFNFDVSGAITALGVGGIAISLGMQDTISNLIGGLQLSLMGTLVPGDHVEVGGRKGIVRDVKWRQVTIETANGQEVIVPNSSINNGSLVKLPPAEKVIVPVNLYKNFDDLDAALAEMVAAVRKNVEKVVPVTRDPYFQLTTVSEYSYTGSLVIWVDLGDKGYPATLEVSDVAVRTIAGFSPKI